MVLRAQYGGSLEATSVAELENLIQVIDFLGIREYRERMSEALRSCHEGRKESSPLNSIEVV